MICLSLVLLLLTLSSCKEKENEVGEQETTTMENSWVDDFTGWTRWGKKIAREMTEDGWVYTFDYLFMKDDNPTTGAQDDAIPFTFYVINLRYRYDRTDPSESDPIQVLGRVGSDAVKRDLDQIWDLLGTGGGSIPTVEELLALDPDTLTFEEFDKDRFFRLMRQALTGEPHAEGERFLLPTYAMLSEPAFSDGYCFQIGFVSGMGLVDIIFIDVLYRDEDAIHGYVQLSDMVDDGTATDEQAALYAFLKQVEKNVVEHDDFLYESDSYQEETMAGVDMSRLYRFLYDISIYNYDNYD